MPPVAPVPLIGITTGIGMRLSPATLTTTVALVKVVPSELEHTTPNSVERLSGVVDALPLTPPEVSCALPGPYTPQFMIFCPDHDSIDVFLLSTVVGFAVSDTDGTTGFGVSGTCGPKR